MKAPLGFENQGVDALFFRNASRYIVIFYIVIAIYLLLQGVMWLINRFYEESDEPGSAIKYMKKFITLANDLFEWGFFFCAYQAAYLGKKMI